RYLNYQQERLNAISRSEHLVVFNKFQQSSPKLGVDTVKTKFLDRSSRSKRIEKQQEQRKQQQQHKQQKLEKSQQHQKNQHDLDEQQNQMRRSDKCLITHIFYL
ncbi:hypothetical protein Tco_0504279, partial [Tanacetum coccineum]